MRTHTAPTAWAQHLADPAACTGAPVPTLTPAEAERVQRHRDQLTAALRAQDRAALLSAKQHVLEAAYHPCGAPDAACDPTDSPALRRALRDLSWRMAGLLLPRSPRH